MEKEEASKDLKQKLTKNNQSDEQAETTSITEISFSAENSDSDEEENRLTQPFKNSEKELNPIEEKDNSQTSGENLKRTNTGQFGSYTPEMMQNIKIFASKQLSRMNSIGLLLSKAKKVNKNTEKTEIFHVDDILVEMAILQMSKTAEEQVFYLKCNYQGKKWTIRKTFEQVKSFHYSLSFKSITRLPNFSPKDKLMYLRVAKYLMYIKQEIKLKKDIQKLVLFLEATYNIIDENIMGEVIKCGWALKQIGGRYKGNKA